MNRAITAVFFYVLPFVCSSLNVAMPKSVVTLT